MKDNLSVYNIRTACCGTILSFLNKIWNIEHAQITIFRIPNICDIAIWACSFFLELSMLPQHAVRMLST